MAANFWNLNSDRSSSSSDAVAIGLIISFSGGSEGRSLKTDVSRPESRKY